MSKPYTKMMASSRAWRIPLLLLVTLLIAVPLWQLGGSSIPGYDGIYDHLTGYFDRHKPQAAHGGANNTTQPYPENNSTPTPVESTTPIESKIPKPQSEEPKPSPTPKIQSSAECDGFPDSEGILLVMKTGATEAYNKLPTHLLTHMQCLPDFLLFSDLDQQIGPYKLQNVLDRVDETLKKERKEFELYRAQQQCPISQMECTADLPGGWDLDKYKFLNMVQRTWEQRPDKEWYVFAEADTYIFWPNLIEWLRERAPRGDQYIGSVAMLGGKPFAHGGSGYVISGSLMRKIVLDIPNLAAKYDVEAGKQCCGDFLIAMAAEEVGGKVLQAHPMFNGEKPNTLPYGPGHWCEPLLTMHHMNAEEINTVWRYEKNRTETRNIQIRDMYYKFMEPHLVNLRQDWDNDSNDICYIGADDDSQARADYHDQERQRQEHDKNLVEKRAHLSASECSKVCEAEGLNISEEEYNALDTDKDRGDYIRRRYDERKDDVLWNYERKCFQWRYKKGACCTSRSFKLGKPEQPENGQQTMSGWFTQGIHNWIKAGGSCDKVDWKEPW